MSYGQELLRKYIILLGLGEFIENYRPDWLKGMELDFYFPKSNRAIEFNGDQHYAFTTKFGDSTAQFRRDKYKKQLCKELGICLRTVDASDLEYTRLVSKIGSNKNNVRHNKVELKKLNKLSIEYRKTLIANYDSLTARRKGTKLRQKAKLKADELRRI